MFSLTALLLSKRKMARARGCQTTKHDVKVLLLHSVFTSFSNAKQKELHTAKKLHKCHNKQSDGFFFLTRKTLLSIVKENFPALETKF